MLIFVPIVSSLGVPVTKMSGRGLGYAGGTIDKLGSLPGLNIKINSKILKKLFKVCLCNNNKVRRDERIYQLRDVTETTESVALIASSIL